MPRACGRGGVKVWRCAAGVQTWRHRGMKLWSFAVKACRRGGVCLKRSGAREACSEPGDVEARGRVCLKSSGALDARCRCMDVEVIASRALEACCGPGEVDVWRSGVGRRMLRAYRRRGIEVWRRTADVQTWRHRGMKVWKCAAGV